MRAMWSILDTERNSLIEIEGAQSNATPSGDDYFVECKTPTAKGFKALLVVRFNVFYFRFTVMSYKDADVEPHSYFEYQKAVHSSGNQQVLPMQREEDVVNEENKNKNLCRATSDRHWNTSDIMPRVEQTATC